MTTNFPTGLDTLTTPLGTDTLGTSTPTHTELHTNEGDAIEALQAKVGINNSTVTGSIDYRVDALETDPIIGLVGGAEGRMITADGLGDFQMSSPADVRSYLNVEDGATADQSDAEIKTAYENNADTNAFTDADHTKLDNIFLESGNDGLIILTRGNPTVNLNASATGNLVEWNVSDQIDTDTYTHSTSTNPSRVEVDVTGRYIIKCYVVLQGDTGTPPTRWSGKMYCRKNGTTNLRGQFYGGYIRMSGNANYATLPLEFVVDLTSGDYIEFLIDRLATTTGVVNTIAGVSLLTMQRLF